MDKLVVSLETAKKLRAAGFPQDASYWHWFGGELTDPNWISATEYDNDHRFAAPTAQEIADQLPTGWEVGPDHTGQYVVQAGGLQMNPEVGDTMAEALALLWLQVSKTSWPLFRKEETK